MNSPSLTGPNTMSYSRYLFPALLLAGCTKPPVPVTPTEAPPVTVAKPLEREVTDHADFTGRTEASQIVEIRARVSGYLTKVNFKPGAEVKKGDVLFEIDPRPYQADLDQARANVGLEDAKLKNAVADYNRNSRLSGKVGAVSQQELDKYLAVRDEADASKKAAEAKVETAKLNLDWTKVLAPCDGRVSRNLIDAGNLVTRDVTMLTTVVADDPMFAYFDVDERTVLQVQRMIREGKSDSARDTEKPLYLGLANEEGFPHRGVIDFIDNQLDAATGTIRLRGSFSNKDGRLTSGLFVRVRVEIGRPHTGLLVTERAVMTDQGQKFLYVLATAKDDPKKVIVDRRDVTAGGLFDGLRVIEAGLRADDQVVVNGLQRVRPGMPVTPELRDMPLPPAAVKAAAQPGAPKPTTPKPAGS
jgi:RND family efflux transporter MFP subunit